MIPLPAARKIWKCGTRWENGELIDTGKGCGQRIYQSDKEKFPSGKYKIKNDEDGRGGKRGEDHKCHNTGFHVTKEINPLEHDYKIAHTFCGVCCNEFNALVLPVCPTCFKLECRHCGNRQTWISGKDNNHCSQCKDRPELRQVFYTWMINGHDDGMTAEQIEIRENRKKILSGLNSPIVK